MAMLDKYNDDPRNAIARERRPRVKRWVGVNGGSSERRYVCYLCDEVIDTESAKYAPTKHAEQAIADHDCTCGN
jgi:hypothetical protein